MIFANEDATLYICQYLHPDDIVALARTNHAIRTMIMPHMRYVVKNTDIRGLVNWIVRREITRPRFARTDITYTIPSAEAFRPDPIPHDYTGVISIRRYYNYGWVDYSEYLWTRGGYVYRAMQRVKFTVKLTVARIDPVHFTGYLNRVNGIVTKPDPDELHVKTIWNEAHGLFNDDLSDEFRALLCFDHI